VIYSTSMMRALSVIFALCVPLAAEDPPRLVAEWPPARGAASPVCCVAFLSDGRLVACDLRGQLVTLDPKDASRAPLASARTPMFGCVALAADGAVAFLGGARGEVWRWDLARVRPAATATPHCSTTACVAFSSDGRLVATGS